MRRRGSLANLDKRRTLLANIKRNAARGLAEVGHLHEDDLRFKVWDKHEEKHANAAVYMLMDRSGSMTTSKKYIAKSFFFWMVRFLRLKYQHVETVFIAHDYGGAGGAGAGLFCALQQRWHALLFGLSGGPGASPAAPSRQHAGTSTCFTSPMAIICPTITPPAKRWCRTSDALHHGGLRRNSLRGRCQLLRLGRPVALTHRVRCSMPCKRLHIPGSSV